VIVLRVDTPAASTARCRDIIKNNSCVAIPVRLLRRPGGRGAASATYLTFSMPACRGDGARHQPRCGDAGCPSAFVPVPKVP